MPYWRLSSFYLFYFAALGVLVPYWGLYLKDLGYSAAQIGELLAIPMATKFLAPYLWGWLGDRLGRRMAIVRLGTFLTLVVFTAIFWVRGYWELAAAMALFSFFWNAVLPQFEAVTFRYLHGQVSRYARVRLWGSVGFILTVVAVGMAVDRWGPGVTPVALMAVFGSIWIASLTVADPQAEALHHRPSPIGGVLRQPAVIAFFVVCFLLQAGHAAYYSFYSIYMEETGYSKTWIGQLWSVGVLAEVGIFLVMHRLLDRFGARRVLIASLALAALRWLLIALFPQYLAVLLAAQTLHAASFGTFHAAAIHLVHHYFVGPHQGRGQALYSALSFGAGGALGSLASGYLWDGAGPAFTFLLAAAVTALALGVSWKWVRDELPAAEA